MGVKDLQKKGWVVASEQHTERDSLRLASEKLQVEFLQRAMEGMKLGKPERELLAFLELHPGWHNLGELTEKLRNASRAARALARRELVRLETEVLRPVGYKSPIPALNRHQQEAVDTAGCALAKGSSPLFF